MYLNVAITFPTQMTESAHLLAKMSMIHEIGRILFVQFVQGRRHPILRWQKYVIARSMDGVEHHRRVKKYRKVAALARGHREVATRLQIQQNGSVASVQGVF